MHFWDLCSLRPAKQRPVGWEAKMSCVAASDNGAFNKWISRSEFKDFFFLFFPIQLPDEDYVFIQFSY